MGRSPGSSACTRAGMSTFKISCQRMWRLEYSPRVSCKTGARLRSTSTAVTRPARRHSCWVRGPMPGPTSSTPQPRSIPDSSAIRWGTQAAMRKFWPLALENRKPWRANSPLTSWALHKSIMKKPPFPCILPEDRRICNENLHQKQDGSRYCFRTGAEAPLASPGGKAGRSPAGGRSSMLPVLSS